jgi:hypothetical protein
MVKRIRKNIYLSPPHLAPLRLGGTNFQIREFSEYFLIKNTLRRALSASAVSHREGSLKTQVYESTWSVTYFGSFSWFQN